jgi:hypothetical protein
MMKNKKSLSILRNKKLIVIVAFILVLIAVGASYFRSKNNDDVNITESKNVFTSVKEALTKNITLACEFNESESTFRSYIKNGAVRIITSGDNSIQAGEMIMKDNRMYVWDSKTKEGFVYDIPKDVDGDSEGIGMASQEVVSSERYLDMIDKYKDSCKVATLDDSFFTPPTDVKFQDMSKFLEDLKSQMPQGYELPNQ